MVVKVIIVITILMALLVFMALKALKALKALLVLMDLMVLNHSISHYYHDLFYLTLIIVVSRFLNFINQYVKPIRLIDPFLFLARFILSLLNDTIFAEETIVIKIEIQNLSLHINIFYAIRKQ